MVGRGAIFMLLSLLSLRQQPLLFQLLNPLHRKTRATILCANMRTQQCMARKNDRNYDGRSGGDDRPRPVSGIPTAATIYTDQLMKGDVRNHVKRCVWHEEAIAFPAPSRTSQFSFSTGETSQGTFAAGIAPRKKTRDAMTVALLLSLDPKQSDCSERGKDDECVYEFRPVSHDWPPGE